MKVRIGIAEANKVVEIDVDDAAAFERTITQAVENGEAVVWVDDSKKRRVGIPVGRLGYIEIETEDAKSSVGFAPSA